MRSGASIHRRVALVRILVLLACRDVDISPAVIVLKLCVIVLLMQQLKMFYQHNLMILELLLQLYTYQTLVHSIMTGDFQIMDMLMFKSHFQIWVWLCLILHHRRPCFPNSCSEAGYQLLQQLTSAIMGMMLIKGGFCCLPVLLLSTVSTWGLRVLLWL